MLKKLPLSSYILFSFILVCLAFLLLANIEIQSSMIIETAFNFGHLPLFGVVALVILWILNHRSWPVSDQRYYLVAFTITFVLGIVTEVAQIFFPERYFEVKDIIYNTLGAITFLTLSYPFPREYRKKGMRLKIISAGIVVLAAVPIIPAVMDTGNMRQNFPVLSSFESYLEMQRWSAKDAEISRSRSHASHGRYSVRTDLAPEEFPGISLEYLMGDWQRYSTLSFDVFNPQDSSLAMVVRIHDRHHNNAYTDRFNSRFDLVPGSNTVVIDLKDVLRAPTRREMDMGNIVNICIFSHNLTERRTVYFDHFRLQ